MSCKEWWVYTVASPTAMKETCRITIGDTFALPVSSGLCSLIIVSPTKSPRSPENICEKYTKWQRKERLPLNRCRAPRVETPEASSSQRKPEQGQYPSGIHHTGICQTKTSFWKFGKQLGVTAFPAPHYGTFRHTKEEKSSLRLDVFASLFLW